MNMNVNILIYSMNLNYSNIFNSNSIPQWFTAHY